ncbi:hypothetical protein [Leptothermofonsia sichuanensis]|nr:hypothetical protein [Leptothermofonsia sichuanensis]
MLCTLLIDRGSGGDRRNRDGYFAIWLAQIPTATTISRECL